MNRGNPSTVLHEESDLEDISSTSCFNALSTVRKRSCHFNHITDSATKVDVDGMDDRAHVFKSVIIGRPGPYVRFPSHSFLAPIGSTAWILMLDCRWVDYCRGRMVS
jgi:hypothetical protein